MRYKKLGKTNFDVSICGFGSYRVDYSVAQHEEALKKALLSGFNLIDTSANYSDGGSELLIGKVLSGLISENKIQRKDICLVSKGGYIQGNNFLIARQREINGNPYPELVKCSPGLWHCIHPEFLSVQIDSSLERLQTDYLDVYLLHNPEYFLQYTSYESLDILREEYYRRIEKAFRYLETEVSAGRIRYYGISSNTFGDQSNSDTFTSLEIVCRIADSISHDNHFAVVQAPLNLMEKACASERNQEDNTETFLGVAEKKNLGVLINRPLNAIVKNKLIRLAGYPTKNQVSLKQLDSGISDLKKIEKEIISVLVETSNFQASDKKALSECLSLGIILEEYLSKFNGAAHFKDMRIQYFVPRANYAIKTLTPMLKTENELLMLNTYSMLVNDVFGLVTDYLNGKTNKQNEEIHRELNNFLPEEIHEIPLSQKALIMINSLENVSCTLVGMRSSEYVADVLSAVEKGCFPACALFWRQE